MIDLHAHILAGLDDGAETIEEAVAMCRCAEQDGASAVVATPHMFNGVYDVRREHILAGVETLRRALADEGLPLTILPGADVHANGDLAAAARANRAMTVADNGKYLMVEFARDVIPPHIEDMLFDLRLMGIIPILSHPERHPDLQTDSAFLEAVVRTGNLVQVTAGSLLGRFGREAERTVWRLLDDGLVHVVASDAHDTRRRPPGLSEARRLVEDRLGRNVAETIFDDTPQRIVAGEEAPLPELAEPALPRRRRTWAWWRR